LLIFRIKFVISIGLLLYRCFRYSLNQVDTMPISGTFRRDYRFERLLWSARPLRRFSGVCLVQSAELRCRLGSDPKRRHRGTALHI
jgi:hypothetical protein